MTILSQGTIQTRGGYIGEAWLNTGADIYGGIDFLVRQIIAAKAFASMVRVVAVSGGGVGVPATVDVQPMVNQVDGLGNQVPHGIVHGLPVFRLQGGNGAVILDPAVGDIGEAIICDRDISAVKATGAVSGPGSYRQNDWSDGCYFGGFLNAAPSNYVRINSGGVAIVSTGTISLNAPGGVSVNGQDFATHRHGGVTPGGGTTGGVV